VQIRKKASQKQNVETYSLASSGGQEKYVKYVSFPWSPLEAVLSIFNFNFFVKNYF
jgi:hypothetical protein